VELIKLEEETTVRSHRSAGCHRGQVLLTAAIVAACCAAFAGYLESSPPSAPQPTSEPAARAASAPLQREWTATTAGSVDADVRPGVAGRVARRLVAAGSLVRQGDLLFEIEPGPFRARLAHARADLARARGPESVDALRAAVEQARLDVQATAVRSPITGVAGADQARVGDLVNPTSVLTRISGIDPIRVRFQLDEPDYLRYLDSQRPGASAARAFGGLELELAGGKTFPHQGYLAAADRQVDLATRTIGVEGLFPNPGNRLRPGQIAKIRERG
jgi:multidrug efflux pump subunit AcrA (membrane-fusion protein)